MFNMPYGQLIIDHQEQEDSLRQQLVVAQEECSQAKKDSTGTIPKDPIGLFLV